MQAPTFFEDCPQIRQRVLMLLPILLAAAEPCVSEDTPGASYLLGAGAVSCESLKPKVPDRTPTVREQAKVKAYFDNELFDGPAARWKFETVKGGSQICGTVNAKNRLGAYTGWHGFIFDLKDGAGSIYDEDKHAWLFEVLCHGADPKTAR
jgi:hypothetical protein